MQQFADARPVIVTPDNFALLSADPAKFLALLILAHAGIHAVNWNLTPIIRNYSVIAYTSFPFNIPMKEAYGSGECEWA